MIYLPQSMMIYGQLPVETPPVAVADATLVTPLIPPVEPEPQVVPIEDLRKVRHEAEANRKEAQAAKQKLDTLLAQIETEKKAKEMAEMSELDRLKAQIAETETRYNTEKTARELEQKRSYLVNIAASMSVALPNMVVNQISLETLKTLDLNDIESFKAQVQQVITEAENAGISLIRQTPQAVTGVIGQPSPLIGATNPPNQNYPRPKITTETQLARLKTDFLTAVSNGDVVSRQTISAQIRKLETQMGTYLPPSL